MIRSSVSRRSLLLSPLAALACRRTKATGYFGFCFVANQDSRSVSVLDLTRFRLRKQIPLEAAPSQVIARSSTGKVYVLTAQTGAVYEIDAVTLAPGRSARAGSLAAGMQLSADGRVLWVLYRDPPSLVELPLDSLQPARRARLHSPPDSFEISSGNLAAIASVRDRNVTLVSLATAEIERTIGTGTQPSILRFQRDGRQLIVGSAPDRSLGIFHTDSGMVVVRLPLPLEPRHFAFNADGGQLFVSGDGMDAVVTVYPYRTEIAETMLAGRAPAAMAASASPPFLLVANPQTDSVTVLDFDNPGKKLVAVVQVGQDPGDILITPDNQYAIVLNRKSSDVSVIRLYTLARLDAAARRRPTPVFTMLPVGEKPVSAAVLTFS